MKDPNLGAQHPACECLQAEARPRRRVFTRALLLALVLGLVSGVWLLRQPLRDKIRESATLANDSPPADVVREMIQQAENPDAALLAAWNSGKIVHREAAIDSIRQLVPINKPLPAQLESLVLAGALDPDMNVRETALGILRDRKAPALTALAAQQLKDPDEQVRLLGLDYLRSAPASVGVPIVAPLLNDPDVAVLGMTLKLLENWSGQKFGAKLADTVQVESKTTGLQEFQEQGVAKTREAAEKAKAWWAEHQNEFPPVKLEVPPAAYAARRPIPEADFQLRSLDGKLVKLSELRGQVVLLNFWTTWCPACVGEMPELVALKAKYGEKVAILGVSLDFVPDEHGHIGGHPPVEEQSKGVEDNDNQEASRAALNRVREKVRRTAKARHVNYPILLDEHNEIGGRYNGGELPTTVIVDAQGNVRRRFIGARNLAVFEAMLAEASQPLALGETKPGLE
ncbi:MAG TPA: redoxin domain-containing protein [Verrucomicrobiae bacterium]|nr:redoxin domain-containing protein [Verrucomicrobiae bacterium]